MGDALKNKREEAVEDRRRKERRRGRILLLALGAFIILTVYSATRRVQEQGTDVAGLSIADYRARSGGDRRPAPEFTAPALGGGELSSSDLEGRVAVVNFWASWCGPCRLEAPDLEATWRAYEGRGVQFLGVNFRDNRYAARSFEDEFGLTYPSAFDPSGSLAHKFQVLALPSTFVISDEGWIEYQFTGVVTEGILRNALEDVLGKGG